jgi:cobalt-zinc-cadmium efflux system outer membrane protein
LAFAQDLAGTADALSALAEARAKEALVAGVEANVARAEAVRLGLIHVEAKRRSETSRFMLALLLGCSERDVTLPDAIAPAAVRTGLDDRRRVETSALTLRGDLQAADMERRVLTHRLSLTQRERIPNVTISAFAERGEIDDRILGIGLSIPVPLPGPLGPSRAGEIAETRAQIRAAESAVAEVRRRVLSQAMDAFAKHQARQAAVRLFPADLLTKARTDLTAIREALRARQLGLREAVVWQRSLVELLQADIEARLAARLADIELRRVAGVLLAKADGSAR